MFQFYKNISLKRKLLLLFYVQIIIPMIFIGVYSYNKAANSIQNNSFNYSQEILKMIEFRVDMFCKDIDTLSLQFLYDNNIYSVLKSNSGISTFENYNNTNYAKNLFRETIASREGIDAICLVTQKKEYIDFDQESSNGLIKYTLPYDYVYDKALEANGENTWVLYKKGNEITDVYAARVINNKDTFKPIGLLVILINKKYVQSIYSELSKNSMDNISILSENNEEIFEDKQDNKYLSFLNNINYKNDKEYFVDNDSKSLISYVVMKKPAWKVVYHISLNDLYKEINILKIEILTLILIGVLVLSLLSKFTAYDILDPINELVKAMHMLETKRVHMSVNLNRNDEIGYLAKTFNTMSSKIDYLVNSIYKEKLTRKEAELKALQAQINPHFLFNTLENINWMAQLNGIKEISTTVTSLAELMEASIGRENRLITLEQEISYIDNYINIFLNRFPEKLNVKKNINDEAMKVLIPKLLIEPIVENSLNHGIERVSRKGELEINGCIRNENLIIEIIDNGIGIKLKQLDSLREALNTDEENIKERDSIGLINVNKRIKLFYGECYGINIESKYDEFTKVTMEIPVKVKVEEAKFYV
jgi:two-component system sensor histidine kinase YesM